MDLKDFIYSSNVVSCTDELQRLFLGYLGDLGFEHFVAGEVSRIPCSGRGQAFGQLSNYPAEWLNHYQAMRYIDCDPVYHEAASGKEPFSWDEACAQVGSCASMKMMNEAGEFGMRSGVGLSIFRPAGSIVGFGFASADEKNRLDRKSLRLLQSAAFQFYLVYVELEKIDAAPAVSLTSREREVLCWVAAGKSKAMIADLLTVSESCVKRHCENIFQKLQTTTLASSVVKAIRLGLVDPL